ncbi:hypothetical protein MMC22_003149 [Lobaria immixta]|nr:hypothetical protein [Lobaria immixta]
MPPKARTSTKSASCASGQYQILSRPSSSDTLIAQPPPDLSEFTVSRNAPATVPSGLNPQAMPSTPRRPASMQPLPPHSLHQGASPILENKLRGSGSKSDGHTQVTSTPAPRNSSDTPRRRPKSQTPSRPNATPSQAYAGPLFHASPAASALPIPKWFSKTVNERKESLEETVSETAAKEQSPNQSDESPTLRKSRMDTKKCLDEKPPKLHLQADRAEKGKGREGNVMPASVDEDGVISPSLSTSTLVDSSASPDTDGAHHPRHRTSPSSAELFPLKTEDSSGSSIPKQRGHLQRNLSEAARPSTAPSDILAQNVDDEEQRRARSLALKKLLQTPVPQRPVSAYSHLQTAASADKPRESLPARNSSGALTSMASPAFKLPYIPCHPDLPSSNPNHNTTDLSEAAQQSSEATQLLAPYYMPNNFDRLKKNYYFDEYGMARASIEKRPLSHGQRAILMEDYLSRVATFKNRPCTASSQLSGDLNSTIMTNGDRANLMEDHAQRGVGTCLCNPATSPQQSSSSVQIASLKNDDPSKRMKDYLRREGSKVRPAISSPQSFPGADSTPVVYYDPKKWLENHLRHDILKIGTLASDGVTGVAT